MVEAKSNSKFSKAMTWLEARPWAVILLSVFVFVLIISVGLTAGNSIGKQTGREEKEKEFSAQEVSSPDEELLYDSVDGRTTLRVESYPTGVAIYSDGECGTKQTGETADYECSVGEEIEETLSVDKEIRQSGVEYVFSGWQGCPSATNEFECRVSVGEGKTRIVKAIYDKKNDSPESVTYEEEAEKKEESPVDTEPWVKLLVNGDGGATAIFEPGYIASINTRPEEGQKTVEVTLELKTANLDRNECSVSLENTTDDEGTLITRQLSTIEEQKVTLTDGTWSITADCGSVNDYLWGRIADGLPYLCKDFSFTETALTATTYEEVKQGMVGEWEGCVDTPWLPDYRVKITFNENGTYQTMKIPESLDGRGEDLSAMYYGTDDDNSLKKYEVTDLLDNGTAVGILDIYFSHSQTTTRGDLKFIKIMDDKLSFEYYHRGRYGPLKFELYRK